MKKVLTVLVVIFILLVLVGWINLPSGLKKTLQKYDLPNPEGLLAPKSDNGQTGESDHPNDPSATETPVAYESQDAGSLPNTLIELLPAIGPAASLKLAEGLREAFRAMAGNELTFSRIFGGKVYTVSTDFLTREQVRLELKEPLLVIHRWTREVECAYSNDRFTAFVCGIANKIKGYRVEATSRFKVAFYLERTTRLETSATENKIVVHLPSKINHDPNPAWVSTEVTVFDSRGKEIKPARTRLEQKDIDEISLAQARQSLVDYLSLVASENENVSQEIKTLRERVVRELQEKAAESYRQEVTAMFETALRAYAKYVGLDPDRVVASLPFTVEVVFDGK